MDNLQAALYVLNYQNPSKLSSELINSKSNYFSETLTEIRKITQELKNGGSLYIYGQPQVLSILTALIENDESQNYFMNFRYWIAIETNDKHRKICTNAVYTRHHGLAFFIKSAIPSKLPPFTLNAGKVRIPYKNCISCQNNLKDWGGKKHLMNPNGTALSDVWSDLSIPYEYTEINIKVLQRIRILSNDSELTPHKQNDTQLGFLSASVNNTYDEIIDPELDNQVLFGDAITHMNKIKSKHPDGYFDLCFADPPYNLEKDYSSYEDSKKNTDYIKWCNRWIEGMWNILKPGGSLFILNLPQWATHHVLFLSDKAILRNWIVWNSMSTPSGKLMPAHYSLLFFTKPGKVYKQINLETIPSRDYCLRLSCIKKRKELGEHKTENISDIWFDIHRIKHKKDRDSHPCQLPLKLMERIITMSTNPGDIVYDPFGGAGTTAISARMTNRRYCISEIDPDYVQTSKNNLNNIREQNGQLTYERKSIKREKSNITKKEIEISYLELCKDKNKILSIEEVECESPDLDQKIKHYEGNFRKLQNWTQKILFD